MALDGATVPAHRRNAVDHNLRMPVPMNDSPSDDDVGRQILSVFMRNRVPVSGMLPRNYFFTVRDGDFQRGLNKAVANDWIAIDRRNRYRYQLTATGHNAGRTIEAPSV
jgi:hypothetical protein